MDQKPRQRIHSLMLAHRKISTKHSPTSSHHRPGYAKVRGPRIDARQLQHSTKPVWTHIRPPRALPQIFFVAVHIGGPADSSLSFLFPARSTGTVVFSSLRDKAPWDAQDALDPHHADLREGRDSHIGGPNLEARLTCSCMTPSCTMFLLELGYPTDPHPFPQKGPGRQGGTMGRATEQIYEKGAHAHKPTPYVRNLGRNSPSLSRAHLGMGQQVGHNVAPPPPLTAILVGNPRLWIRTVDEAFPASSAHAMSPQFRVLRCLSCLFAFNLADIRTGLHSIIASPTFYAVNVTAQQVLRIIGPKRVLQPRFRLPCKPTTSPTLSQPPQNLPLIHRTEHEMGLMTACDLSRSP